MNSWFFKNIKIHKTKMDKFKFKRQRIQRREGIIERVPLVCTTEFFR